MGKRLNLNLKQTKESDYIKGVLDGDGHTTDRKLILEVTSKDFAGKFLNYLYVWTNHKGSITKKKLKSGKDSFRVLFCNKDVVEFMNNYGEVKNPEEYISGVFDSDGSVSTCKWRNTIQLKNKRKWRVDYWKKMLNLIGVKSYIYSDEYKGMTNYKVVLSSKKDNLRLFNEKVTISVDYRQNRLNNILK